MNKIFIVIILLLIAVVVYFWVSSQVEDFEELSPAEMLERIIQERDFAIGQAVMAGDYKCCISPPCTMCFMEGNQWNNGKAGTCACDELIARGEESCPQCKSGLIKDTGSSCEISATCDVQENKD